jgi:3-hydroxymyristoyl/3-hydroxydecanoyl-(acyl carrier protein) dehydratase
MVFWTQEPRREADGTITAETAVGADDPWFEGHFPEEPVLPAVAQLALAWEAIGALAGRQWRLAGFRRVKFKEMIRPGQRLLLTAVARDEGGSHFAFRLHCAGRLACTGSLLLERRENRR